MPALHLSISDRAYKVIEDFARTDEQKRSIEQLAEETLENLAVRAITSRSKRDEDANS